MTHAETQFVVEVTAADEIVCRAPDHAVRTMRMTDVAAVYVETNDGGPWGADVWWLLIDDAGQTRGAFPQLASGEDAALQRLRQLPGFELRGMNSTENKRLLCWQSAASAATD